LASGIFFAPSPASRKAPDCSPLPLPFEQCEIQRVFVVYFLSRLKSHGKLRFFAHYFFIVQNPNVS